MSECGPNCPACERGRASSWTARAQRLDPASDVLIVKVNQRITPDQAHRIKAQIRRELPAIKVLIFDQGVDVVVLKKRRTRTLVKARRLR